MAAAHNRLEQAQKHHENGAAVVNPDSIRMSMHGQRYAALAEPFVWAIAKVMVRSLFLAGHDIVILDATNTTRKRRDEWLSSEWNRSFYCLDTTKEECLRRANGDDEIIPVIERMAAEFESLGSDEMKCLPLG